MPLFYKVNQESPKNSEKIVREALLTGDKLSRRLDGFIPRQGKK